MDTASVIVVLLVERLVALHTDGNGRLGFPLLGRFLLVQALDIRDNFGTDRRVGREGKENCLGLVAGDVSHHLKVVGWCIARHVSYFIFD